MYNRHSKNMPKQSQQLGFSFKFETLDKKTRATYHF